MSDETTIASPVNTNTRVWVRLTDYGHQVFDKHHTDMGLDPEPHRRLADIGGGWLSFQLWDLISVFGGPHTIYLGGPVPFEGNVIHFTDPTRPKDDDELHAQCMAALHAATEATR